MKLLQKCLYLCLFWMEKVPFLVHGATTRCCWHDKWVCMSILPLYGKWDYYRTCRACTGKCLMFFEFLIQWMVPSVWNVAYMFQICKGNRPEMESFIELLSTTQEFYEGYCTKIISLLVFFALHVITCSFESEAKHFSILTLVLRIII